MAHRLARGETRETKDEIESAREGAVAFARETLHNLNGVVEELLACQRRIREHLSALRSDAD